MYVDPRLPDRVRRFVRRCFSAIGASLRFAYQTLVSREGSLADRSQPLRYILGPCQPTSWTDFYRLLWQEAVPFRAVTCSTVLSSGFRCWTRASQVAALRHSLQDGSSRRTQAHPGLSPPAQSRTRVRSGADSDSAAAPGSDDSRTRSDMASTLPRLGFRGLATFANPGPRRGPTGILWRTQGSTRAVCSSRRSKSRWPKRPS